MHSRLIILIFLSLSFLSCIDQNEDYDPGFGGPEYFPLGVGDTWIYQLDSVIYDPNAIEIDTVSYKIREIITDKLALPDIEENYRIERSEFLENESKWIVSDIWSASIDNRLAYKTEENLRFSKLSWPVSIGNSWDGNAFIDEEIIIRVAGEPIRIYQSWGDYIYLSSTIFEKIGEHTYNEVITVLQTDLEDKISKRFSLEKYAKGIGLVYKKMIILNTQQFDSVEPWEIKAEEGFILEQTLLDYVVD